MSLNDEYDNSHYILEDIISEKMDTKGHVLRDSIYMNFFLREWKCSRIR